MTDEATPPSRGSTWGRGWRQRTALVLIVLVAVVLVVLNTRTTPTPEQPPVVPTATTAQAGPALSYLALGDSLSRGVQPDDALTLKHGYPRVLTASLKQDLRPAAVLTEAGCGGATTASFIFGGKACAPDAPIPYANQDANSSQLNWAVSALHARGNKPTLVTLTIGGNDLTTCLNPSANAVKSCLDDLLPGLKTRWATIARRLKEAARRTVLAVATTYDPILAYIRLQGGKNADAAREFHRLIVRRANPAMKRIFALKGWQIADLGYAMHEGGAIKDGHARAVNAVCALTWACNRGDVHLNDEGYQVAASVFEGAILDPLTKAVKAPLASGSSS